MFSSQSPVDTTRWRFGQCFGEKNADDNFVEADILSAVEFDETGDYLATGDKGGRIVIFEREDAGKRKRRPLTNIWNNSSRRQGAGNGSSMDDDDSNRYAETNADQRQDMDVDSSGMEYRFYTEFQSHIGEFDYLKSIEIEEKINNIAWAKRINGNLMLLSTNDRTIKLWRISEKCEKGVSNFNLNPHHEIPVNVNALRVPKVSNYPYSVVANPRRVYGNVHLYHLHSISCSADKTTFLSADDLRINVWDMENAELSFNVLDIKPPSLETLTEVITVARFHPISDAMFLYSISRGYVKLADLRAASLCDNHAKTFDPADDPHKNYYSEIVSSISDAKFSRDGRYIIVRDFLTIKIWDTHMDSHPIRVIPVHEYLRPNLEELYQNECIFDKFDVDISGDGRHIVTGSYNSTIKIFDTLRHTEAPIVLTKFKPTPPVLCPIPIGRPLCTETYLRSIMGGGKIKGAENYASGQASISNSTVSALSPDEEFSHSSTADLSIGGNPIFPSSTAFDSTPSTEYGLFGQPEYGANDMRIEDTMLDDPDNIVQMYGPPLDVPPRPHIEPSSINFNKKVMHFSWHPDLDCIAIGGLNNLYIYTGGG